MFCEFSSSYGGISLLGNLCGAFVCEGVFTRRLLGGPLTGERVGGQILFLSRLLFSVIRVLLEICVICYRRDCVLVRRFGGGGGSVAKVRIIPS